MQTQDMLSEADNFALVTCNEQNRLPSLIGRSVTLFDERPLLSPPGDCAGRPDNSGSKRPPRSPRGVPWLPKAADLASKFHREPPWQHLTRLVPVESVQYSSRVCLVPFGSVQWKTAQTRPINTRLLKVTQVRIQKIFLDHFRADRPVL
ncbi:hypothetical protein CRG98_038989 [Punica granatum]|uniref:Uncharacterized protein n=1 Tax=Punica granatum TaxID=22663 RepID=A0A2I0IAC2_PUNGR|nr:hypothetical protein CRG98_038989 [Punica granatum]